MNKLNLITTDSQDSQPSHVVLTQSNNAFAPRPYLSILLLNIDTRNLQYFGTNKGLESISHCNV